MSCWLTWRDLSSSLFSNTFWQIIFVFLLFWQKQTLSISFLCLLWVSHIETHWSVLLCLRRDETKRESHWLFWDSSLEERKLENYWTPQKGEMGERLTTVITPSLSFSPSSFQETMNVYRSEKSSHIHTHVCVRFLLVGTSFFQCDEERKIANRQVMMIQTKQEEKKRE